MSASGEEENEEQTLLTSTSKETKNQPLSFYQPSKEKKSLPYSCFAYQHVYFRTYLLHTRYYDPAYTSLHQSGKKAMKIRTLWQIERNFYDLHLICIARLPPERRRRKAGSRASSQPAVEFAFGLVWKMNSRSIYSCKNQACCMLASVMFLHFPRSWKCEIEPLSHRGW